eukprot:9478231-Pyramimonas_sp.AAC.1
MCIRDRRAPIAGGERECTHSGHQSQKGRENVPIAGTVRPPGHCDCDCDCDCDCTSPATCAGAHARAGAAGALSAFSQNSFQSNCDCDCDRDHDCDRDRDCDCDRDCARDCTQTQVAGEAARLAECTDNRVAVVYGGGSKAEQAAALRGGADVVGTFSLPFCDWCQLRVYSLSPSAMGANY